MNPAEDYHEHSKYAPYTLPRLLSRMRGHEAWLQAQPFALRPEKAYPGAATVDLERPRSLHTSLGATLWRRRSLAPGSGPMRRRDLATLLWCLQGQRSDGHRTAPSAGALYPLEAYVLAAAVHGLEPGAYHYSPGRHALERMANGANGVPTDRWYVERRFDAAAHVVVTAVLPRLEAKYDQRAYRFALLEAGHAVQTMLLGATALRLAALPVGGFYDDRVHDGLGLDGVEEVALYVVPVGKPAPSA